MKIFFELDEQPPENWMSGDVAVTTNGVEWAFGNTGWCGGKRGSWPEIGGIKFNHVVEGKHKVRIDRVEWLHDTLSERSPYAGDYECYVDCPDDLLRLEGLSKKAWEENHWVWVVELEGLR